LDSDRSAAADLHIADVERAGLASWPHHSGLNLPVSKLAGTAVT
jgi:hypothetical protein